MYAIEQRRLLQRGSALHDTPRKNFMQQFVMLAPRYLICGVVALFVLVPLFVAVIGGFKTTGELLNSPFSIPSTWHWENYTDILTQGDFWGAVMNSLVTTVATVVLLMVVACPTAFVFARIDFRGREVIYNIMLFGLLFPATMALLPLFIMLRNLTLLDSLMGIILPQVAFGIPTTILILRNFFVAIPNELEDATYIDGGTQIDFFWRVLLPLARPSLATVGMLAMVSSWNNFMLPLLVLNNQKLWTLPLGIMQFQTEHSTDWASIMAFVSIITIPAICFYLFSERYLISGLTAGAVKG